jgi:acetyl-CoA C-acetyltransferase
VVVHEKLRRKLLRLGRAKTAAERARAVATLRPTDIGVQTPANTEPRTGLSMGEHMAITAARWGITREAQDELALSSHQKLAAAYERGFFDDLMTPYLGLTRDQNLRPDTTPEKMASLRTVFGTGEDADGASAVLLGSEEWAAERGLTPLAWFVDGETAAVDYVSGDEGLLMAPAYAVPRLLARNGLSLQDFDVYEIHEAFAATVLATLAAWEDETFCRERLGLDAPLGAIDRSRLNPNGSSLAAGHPFAATGGRIVAGLAKELHARGPGSRGLVSVCAAGGQGVVAILEAA